MLLLIIVTLEWEYKHFCIFLFQLEIEMLGPPHYISIYHYCLQRYQHLKQQWEMKSEEAELLQTKIQQSAYHKQQEDLLALKKTIGETKVFFFLQLKVNCRERYLAVEKQTAKGKNSFENICFIFWSIS